MARRAAVFHRPHGLSARWLFTGGFLLLSAVLLILVGKLLAPFAHALLWAGAFTIVVYPVYAWLLRLAGGRRAIAAGVTTVLVAGALIGPVAFLVTMLARESRDAYDAVRAAMASGGLDATLDRSVHALATWLPAGLRDEGTVRAVEAWLREAGTSAVATLSVTLNRAMNRVIADAAGLLVKGFVMLIALFYFLREGDAWLARARNAVPLSPRVWDLVMVRFRDTLRAVVHGMLLSAAILALLLAAGYRFTGVPVPAFLGMLSFFAAPIPFVGVLIVWVPACAYLFLAGSPDRAWLLVGYGAVVIFIVDNLLRPAIIGSIAKLPAFFMLIAILGGLIAYGPLGLFLGPVLLAIALAVGGVYREIAGGGARSR